MFVRRRAVAALIGLAVFAAGGGCYRGHGRPVILLPRGHRSSDVDHGSDISSPGPNGGYQPVQEYPVPAPPADSGGGGPMLQEPPLPALENGGKNSPGSAYDGRSGEPDTTQRMLIPEAQPKVGFWHKIGNGFESAFGLTQGYRTVGTSAIYEAKAAGGQLAKKTADVFKKPAPPPITERPVAETVHRESIRFEPTTANRTVSGENDFETVSTWYDHPTRQNAPQIGAISPSTPSNVMPTVEMPNDPIWGDTGGDRVRTADQGPRLMQ